MTLKKLLLATALVFASSGAWAQCNGVFQPGTACGNNTGSPKPPTQIPLNSLVNPPGGTNGQIQYNNAGAFGGFTANGDATINTTTGAVTTNPQPILNRICTTAGSVLWNSAGTWVCQSLAQLSASMGLPVSIGLFSPGGTANDTVGVQAAFTACTSYGGCVLTCGNGVTYTVDAITVTSSTQLKGSCIFQQRNTNANILTLGSSVDVTVDGPRFLAVLGPTQNAPLIVGSGCGRLRVTNSYFRGAANVNTNWPAASGANGVGIRADTCEDVFITQNYFTRITYLPIQARANRNLIIDGNVMQYTSFMMYLSGNRNFTVTNNIGDTTLLYSTTPTASQFTVAIGLESTAGGYGPNAYGTIANNVIRDYGWAQGVLGHAGSDITVTGNTCTNVALCVSFNPFNITDTISNIAIVGNQTDGAVGVTQTDSDVGITVQGGAPNPEIYNVTISGNVVANGNRAVADPLAGCILLGRVIGVVITNNVLTGCGANGIAVSTAIDGGIFSNNLVTNIVAAGGQQNGAYFTPGSSGARMNVIGNYFQTMQYGVRYATGITVTNIQNANSLCIATTSCSFGP